MKKILIALAIFIALAFLILVSLLTGKKTSQGLLFGGPTPTPVVPSYIRGINYSGIFSDQKTQDEVTGSLTTPSSTATQGNYSVLTFPQSNGQTTLYMQGEKATYVEKTQTNDNTLYTDFKNAHPGISEYTLYDPKGLAEAGFEWRVFPDQGIAYLTNTRTGFVMTTLYFAQTSYQSFLDTVGKDFSLQTTNNAGNSPESFE